MFLLPNKQNRLDDKGQVIRINFNNAVRDTVFDVPIERVQPFYSALKEFVDLMNSKEYKYTFKMNPGEWRKMASRLVLQQTINEELTCLNGRILSLLCLGCWLHLPSPPRT